MNRRFEHRTQALLSPAKFRVRLFSYGLKAGAIIGGALSIGILGYHFFESLPWIDSFLNASMILGGMGPVDTLQTEAGKIFAGLYALFSGIIFIVVAGLLFSPIAHRMLHRFHFDGEN